MVEAVHNEFGIRKKVQHELYKLLIYEEGSFFAPHRDIEKIPGMFATRVVSLPSRHEITPVTGGYRVCLVYNLAIPRQKKQPAAPVSSHAVDAVAESLPKFFADDSRDKIVIPFKHQYSESALDPRELKGGPIARPWPCSVGPRNGSDTRFSSR